MEIKQYYSDILHCLLRCFVFQSPIHNRWAVQYGTILIREAYIDSNTVCVIRSGVFLKMEVDIRKGAWRRV